MVPSLTNRAKDTVKYLAEGWQAGTIPQQFTFTEITGDNTIIATLCFDSDFDCPPRHILTELAEAKLVRLVQSTRGQWEVTLLNPLIDFVQMENRSNDGVGVYFTPVALITTLINLVKPGPRDIIYDPACGVASLLLAAKAYIESNHHLNPVERQRLAFQGLYGREINLQTYQHARENFGREGINEGNLWHGNTLLKNTYTPGFPRQFDIVVCNAPFSERATAEEQANFPVTTRFMELLFLQHAIESLKRGGRCAIVMPDGVVSRTDPEFREVKRRLLDECRLDHIIQLADPVAPYARVKSSILFFTKGEPTTSFHYVEAEGKTVELSRTAVEERYYDLTPSDEAPAVNEPPGTWQIDGDTNRYRIFISYRRDDTAWPAGRLYDYLGANVDSRVFMDLAAISPGELFTRAIETALTSCDVLLVMIGSKWCSITDKQGRRRLDQADDLVRREIATALARRIDVIPVLVDDVEMPGSDELPDDLKELALRNAVMLTTRSFEDEAKRIAQKITQRLYTTDYDQQR